MKNVILRIVAFILDMILCSVIILGLSMISFINPNNEKTNKKYKEYNENRINYNTLIENVDDYFSDGYLSEKEYNSINSKYPLYIDAFKDIEFNVDIKNKQIETLKDRLLEINVDTSNKLSIEINKLNWIQIVISFVVYVLYFGVLQYFLHGQTIFKRLFRLKVESTNKKKISLLSYIIRAVLISEIILSFIDLALIFTISDMTYLKVNRWLTEFKYIYEMAFIVCLIMRDDMRSLHDLILHTEVNLYDKTGKKIKSKLFEESDEDDKKINHKNNKSLSKNAS